MPTSLRNKFTLIELALGGSIGRCPTVEVKAAAIYVSTRQITSTFISSQVLFEILKQYIRQSR